MTDWHLILSPFLTQETEARVRTPNPIKIVPTLASLRYVLVLVLLKDLGSLLVLLAQSSIHTDRRQVTLLLCKIGVSDTKCVCVCV